MEGYRWVALMAAVAAAACGATYLIGSALGILVFNYLRSLGQVDLLVRLCYVVFLGIVGGRKCVVAGPLDESPAGTDGDARLLR